MASIEERVDTLVKPKIEEIGYKLYDIEYAKEGKDYFLRIFIDKDEGIDLNDCEKVNNLINPLLDTEDYIKETYFLEVSSPGIERVLRKDEHLKDAIGKEVEISLFKPLNNIKTYVGKLLEFSDDNITIEILDDNNCVNKISIERKNITLIKLKYNW